jgi:monofunctional biosynthetic peptidoglycan transglycosylase
MQLARNLYLSPSRNPLRKAKEILIARRLERELGKRRILELYLNVVEWGKGVFGCQAAAQAYFSKDCADLTPDEAVAMAVVLPNPRRWSPAKGGRYVERNSRRIVARMRASGLWPEDDEPPEVAAAPAPLPDAPAAQPAPTRGADDAF